MILNGTEEALLNQILLDYPGARSALEISSSIRGQIRPYQAAALYALAHQCRSKGTDAHVLEIGAALGYSISIVAQALPEAGIVTLNPVWDEVVLARQNLNRWCNVTVIQEKSWDYLEEYAGPKLNLIFVDGDHNHIRNDIPWWQWVEVGGLMLFHDYDAVRCPPIYDTLNLIKETLGRMDVCVEDDTGIGMAGFYKREGDPEVLI